MGRLQKHKYGVLLFMVFSAAGILYSLNQILNQEVFQWIMNQREYKTMMAETAELFAAFCLSGFLFPKSRQKLVAAVLITAVFLWAHVAFVPVLVSGLYLAYILFFGRFLRVSLWRLPKDDGVASDFLTGAVFLIVIFCFMSAVGIGSIGHLTVFVFISGGILLLFGRSCLGGEGNGSGLAFSGKEIFLLAFLLTMVCLQAGRLNIAVDYDSLWYGVRSRYILDNGHGIYENLGTIGIVYTYSKGFEVLTLPLSQLPSYSFVTSINLWLSLGVLFMGYKIGRFYMKREQAVFLAALLSGVPGIMNMAVTAKSDIITLLVQEIMLYYLLCYIKAGQKSWRYLGYGTAAFFLSLTLKPTALIFSTAVFGMGFLYLLGKFLLPRFGAEGGNTGGVAVVACALLALGGIWARTQVLTGLPLTSVFSSLLTRIGFHLKYPFMVNTIPNSGSGMSLKERTVHLANRLHGFFFCPVGEDMDHVILAWGGFLLYFLLLLWIVSCFYGKNVDRGKKSQLSVFLKVIYVPFLVVNLVSLGMLTQVDGNYFMLFYVLTAVYVLKAAVETGEKTVWRGGVGAGVWVLMFAVFFTAMTSWNWSLGFTPVSFHHKGYYNHQEAARQDMVSKGNGEIWDILAADPETRLIAIGDHPDVLAFPCNVQSYDDITGVWGNVALVKKMDYFVEFMDYAKSDYVYVQAGYTGEENRSYTLVRDLIEWGKLVPVCYDNGNLLAAVEVNGDYSEKSAQALTEFEQCYIKKKANDNQ
ncbi:sodium:solute symporter [Lacrimispora sp.]|uniref:sodium:solute symporter n=1 Tax=Lacrimispora sp. TaxID=2719234 RepID=UPI00285577F7|nr:sodium:solute symporter [Lacrimispora sp.]MDR7815010.1 sodium:solute symporter [Lacrimispora sp.]